MSTSNSPHEATLWNETLQKQLNMYVLKVFPLLILCIGKKPNRWIFVSVIEINFLRSCTRDELINFLMLSIRSRSHLEVLCFLPFWMNGVGKQQECFKEFIIWNFWMNAPVGTRNSFDRYCTEGGRSCVKVRVHIIQIMNKKLIIKFSSSDFYEWNKLIHFEERMASEPID